jgi:glucokinase
MKKSARGYLVGVDIGGSKIMAGLFTRGLKLLDSVKISTHAQRGPDDVLERIVGCIEGLLDSRGLAMSDVEAVGVGTPGIIDNKTGTVIAAPLLQWERFALKARLQKALKRPVSVHNDCSVAMAAIYEIELKRKPRNALGIFMGTGLGGALVLDGHLYTGTTGIAGEVGHIVVEKNGPPCPCGSRGCFEVFASRSGIADRLRAEMKKGQTTSIKDILEKDRREPGTLRTGTLRTAMKSGDKLVRRTVHEAAEYTGVAIANLINLLSPDVVVLGGGLIDTLKGEIMPIIDERVEAQALLRFLKKPQVFATRLGDKAGITGAAVMARRGGHLSGKA